MNEFFILIVIILILVDFSDLVVFVMLFDEFLVIRIIKIWVFFFVLFLNSVDLYCERVVFVV